MLSLIDGRGARGPPATTADVVRFSVASLHMRMTLFDALVHWFSATPMIGRLLHVSDCMGGYIAYYQAFCMNLRQARGAL